MKRMQCYLFVVFILLGVCTAEAREQIDEQVIVDDLSQHHEGQERASLEVERLAQGQYCLRMLVKSDNGRFIGLWSSEIIESSNAPRCELGSAFRKDIELPILTLRIQGQGFSKGYVFNFGESVLGLMWQGPAEQLSQGAGLPMTEVKPAKSSKIAEPDEITPISGNVYRVKTITSFLRAIGPNRVIELEAGNYEVGDAKTFVNTKNVQIDEQGIIIKNLQGLELVGVGDGDSHIRTQNFWINVLTLENCKEVVLRNLKLGHGPEKGACGGGVIFLDGCKRVKMDSLDLYGCGTEGLYANRCSEIECLNTTIRECTYAMFSLKKCKSVEFRDCSLRDNDCYRAVVIENCGNVTLSQLSIENNKVNERNPIILVEDSSITVQGVRLANNTTDKLSNDETIAAQLRRYNSH